MNSWCAICVAESKALRSKDQSKQYLKYKHLAAIRELRPGYYKCEIHPFTGQIKLLRPTEPTLQDMQQALDELKIEMGIKSFS